MEKVIEKPKAPCKGCEERVLGCHDQCERYQDYRKKQDKYNLAVRKEKYKNYGGDEY